MAPGQSRATLIAVDTYRGRARQWFVVKTRRKDGAKRYKRKVKGVRRLVTVKSTAYVPPAPKTSLGEERSLEGHANI